MHLDWGGFHCIIIILMGKRKGLTPKACSKPVIDQDAKLAVLDEEFVEEPKAPELPEVQITARSMDLSLNMVPGSAWVLTQLQTFEKCSLPVAKECELELVASPDGLMSMVVGLDANDPPGEVCIDPDDIFKVKLVMKGEKDFVVENGSLIPVEELHVRHKTGQCTIRPDSVSSWSINVAVFRKGKGSGFLGFWSVLDLYERLGFAANKNYKIPSKWYSKFWSRWESRVQSVLGSGVHLIHCCQPGEVKDTMAWQRRCLPWPGVSTGALFVLLTKWSGDDTQAGALEGHKARKVCKDMFSTIVAAALHVAGPSTLKVFMVRKWVPFFQWLMRCVLTNLSI